MSRGCATFVVTAAFLLFTPYFLRAQILTNWEHEVVVTTFDELTNRIVSIKGVVPVNAGPVSYYQPTQSGFAGKVILKFTFDRPISAGSITCRLGRFIDVNEYRFSDAELYVSRINGVFDSSWTHALSFWDETRRVQIYRLPEAVLGRTTLYIKGEAVAVRDLSLAKLFYCDGSSPVLSIRVQLQPQVDLLYSSSDELSLRITGTTINTYSIETANDPSDPFWTPLLRTNLIDNPLDVSLPKSLNGSPMKFFRASTIQ